MLSASVILQLICPDRPALVSELAGWVAANGGNIRHADHHTDAGAGLFLSRIEWGLEGFGLPREAIAPSAAALAQRLDGEAQLHFSDEHPRVAILASKQSHCLLDLLWRARSGELPMQVPLVIANHPDLEPICADFNIPFVCVPVERNRKAEAEQTMLQLLREHDVELAVLAKYMQVLSADFLEQFPTVINIHHSFLPAFAGAKPYHAAHDRGVKIIGATSHYVTSELDAGPIIEQGVTRCSHVDTVQNLIRKGRDLEKIILSQAVYKHLQRKILVYKNRTVVFN